MAMEKDDTPKKRGRPQVDPKKVAQILDRYTDGESITYIAQKERLARATVARIIEEEFGYDFSKHKPIDTPSTPTTTVPEDDEPPAETPQPQPENAMAPVYRTIDELGGNSNQPSTGPPSELGQMQRQLAQWRKELRAVEREYSALARGGGTGGEGGTDISELQEQLNKAENGARAVLEKLGYKVSREGEPTTVEEAKEFLKGQGFRITDPRLTLEEVEEQIEQIKTDMAAEWQKKLDEASEDRRIEAGENIIAVGIDRVCSLFELPLQQALGTQVDKTVQRKRTAQEILAEARKMRAQVSSPPHPNAPPPPTPAPPPSLTPPHLVPIDVKAKEKGKGK